MEEHKNRSWYLKVAASNWGTVPTAAPRPPTVTLNLGLLSSDASGFLVVRIKKNSKVNGLIALFEAGYLQVQLIQGLFQLWNFTNHQTKNPLASTLNGGRCNPLWDHRRVSDLLCSDWPVGLTKPQGASAEQVLRVYRSHHQKSRWVKLACNNSYHPNGLSSLLTALSILTYMICVSHIFFMLHASPTNSKTCWNKPKSQHPWQEGNNYLFVQLSSSKKQNINPPEKTRAFQHLNPRFPRLWWCGERPVEGLSIPHLVAPQRLRRPLLRSLSWCRRQKKCPYLKKQLLQKSTKIE